MLRLNCIILLFLCAVTANAAEVNPFIHSKVGDWIEYTGTLKRGGKESALTTKQTVIKKTDTEVVVEFTWIPGPNMKTVSQYTVDLSKKFDPCTSGIRDAKLEVKEIDKGEESVTVGGKTLKTHWVQYEIRGTVSGYEMNGKEKFWYSSEIPLSGIVKRESENTGGRTVLELKDYGTGK